MVVDRDEDGEAEEAVEEVTEGEVELKNGGAAPEVSKPLPVSQSAVEDGQEGEEVTTATYQDHQEDVEHSQDPVGVLSEHLRLAALSLLVETVIVRV